MPWLSAAGRDFHYTRPGRGRGPALLLLHGAGGSHLDWPRALQRLPGRTIYNLDLPGHGRDQGPGRDTIPAYAADVVSFVAALGLPEMVLVGHSMGSAIALTIALEQPSWLRGLVLLGASARLRVAPALLEGLGADPQTALASIARLAGTANFPRQSIMSGAPEVTLGDFRACDAFDLRARLAEVTAPALVISGELDQMTPAKYGRALAEGLPRGSLLIVPGAGHFLALEAPQVVAAAVAAFLNDLGHA